MRIFKRGFMATAPSASGTLTERFEPRFANTTSLWNSTVFSNPRAALDYITTQLKATGLTNITGNVQCYGCCFYNLSSTDANNHDAVNQLPYNASAATNFVAALQAQGITVHGSPMGQTGFTAPGTLLYTYRSMSPDLQRATVAAGGGGDTDAEKVSHNVDGGRAAATHRL